MLEIVFFIWCTMLTYKLLYVCFNNVPLIFLGVKTAGS